MENQFLKFHDSVVNYTVVQFEYAEIEMLETGLKHSPYLNSRREKNLVNFTAEVELTVNNFLNDDVETKDDKISHKEGAPLNKGKHRFDEGRSFQ
ncbi:hypothetical protein HHI36_008887 [Cryptolaemus montrouzieri]|uniref:Uncharacterized protein n=1 Tax=Cryptolaemus montrouzieri TaxID=559131 RepID=A0ABD2MTT4_9CUCU